MIPKLKKEHLSLTSFARMRVNLAAQVTRSKGNCSLIIFQVLSNSVAKALNYFYLDETAETEEFVWKFNRFFDCMNVRSMTEGVEKRNPDLRPYRDSEDDRLKVMGELLSPVDNDLALVISGSRMTSWDILRIGRSPSIRGMDLHQEKSRGWLSKEV